MITTLLIAALCYVCYLAGYQSREIQEFNEKWGRE